MSAVAPILPLLYYISRPPLSQNPLSAPGIYPFFPSPSCTSCPSLLAKIDYLHYFMGKYNNKSHTISFRFPNQPFLFLPLFLEILVYSARLNWVIYNNTIDDDKCLLVPSFTFGSCHSFHPSRVAALQNCFDLSHNPWAWKPKTKPLIVACYNNDNN